MLQNNITEALRLFPPLIMLMRQVKRTFSVTTRTGQTYTIPKVLLLILLKAHQASPYFSLIRRCVGSDTSHLTMDQSRAIAVRALQPPAVQVCAL